MTNEGSKDYSDKDNSIFSADYIPPGQLSGALKQAQGAVYQVSRFVAALQLPACLSILSQ